jgi:hypothetical protein
MPTLDYQSVADARRERPGWAAADGGAILVSGIVADALGGRVEVDADAGRCWILVPVGQRTASIESNSGLGGWLAVTAVRVPFAGRAGFCAGARPATMLDRIGEWLGAFDVHVGVEPFDSAFVLRGVDHARVRAVFNHGGLRAALMAEPAGTLDIGGVGHRRYGSFALPGVVTEITRLRRALHVVATVVDQLAAIGLAD